MCTTEKEGRVAQTQGQGEQLSYKPKPLLAPWMFILNQAHSHEGLN